ncbi:serine/threonine-protein kinase pelle isoform X3 [Hylaeus anthracinus]|uniref:serine/threonine-protein kinase pelle isoform X3 n=1 Tax=Hylaeus anthracinus TaxID=313031 RepID=UPI0023B8BAE1|nr:serine/threonine-protein kinase pelle isoform X3 [Hylaeus anthracinus]
MKRNQLYNMSLSSCTDKIKYIYQLPVFERKELCNILNQNDKWEELAGIWMEYDMLTIQCLRREKNPTDELLTMWGHYNHTILELFVLLSRMQHYQAMAGAYPLPHSIQNVPSDKKNNDVTIPRTEATLPHATYNELSVATNEWNKYNILGKGGFGTVYKGTWKNTDVAIKKIEKRGPDSDESYILQLQQSLREIKILNSCPHENILPLYAYSLDGRAPCLVYQLMKNGSLEDRLLVKQKSQPLTWIQRHEIAKGTARGLQYLHTIGGKPLIHGDIKSANILLDKNFEPRIGDFGLAREGPERDSMKVSKIHGTRPYLPEEFLHGRKLSTKVDTYSYGIVLFELATGLPAYDDSRLENKFLKDFIDSWEDRYLPLLIDNKAGEKDKQVYNNLMFLGKWCTNHMAQNRPEMDYVFKKLNDL